MIKRGLRTEGQIRALERLYLEKEAPLNGLIIAPVSKDEMLIKLLQAFEKEGTKIIFVDDDLPEVDRVCCVAPSDEYIGNLGAELLCGMLNHRSGKILLAGGNPTQSAHLLNIKGFIEYMKEYRPDIEVILVRDGADSESSYRNFKSILAENDDIIAAYSVRAKNNIPLCKAVCEEDAKNIIIVGSDLFAESESLLKDGTLSAVIYKNPYQKGYTAFKILFDSIVKGVQSKEDLIYVPIGIILRSNLRFIKTIFNKKEEAEMKKRVTLLAAAMLMMGLTACGGSGGAADATAAPSADGAAEAGQAQEVVPER